MDSFQGDILIRDLLTDSREFNERGSAYNLLQEYFQGLSLETLRPLLAHDDTFVRRSAAFIVSELGIEAEPLIFDIVPLIQDSDPHTHWYAIESVMLCSVGKHAELFVNVVRELEDKSDSIRVLTMDLVANANALQLEAGIRASRSLDNRGDLHDHGLRNLLLGDSINCSQVTEMIDSQEPLLRKYGAIAAKRLFKKLPELLEHCLASSDPDISDFSSEAFKQNAR